MSLEDIAQMTKLEERAEKAEAEAKSLHELARKRSDTIVKLLQRVKDFEAEREKLIEALKKYGRHINDCLGHIGSPCTCGLRAVLAEAKEQG